MMLSLEARLKLALEEDLGSGDVTTEAIVPPEVTGRAAIVAKQEGVVCGLEVVDRVMRVVDPHLQVTLVSRDGDWVQPGLELARVSGLLASILRAERVSLNLLGHLSGIATLTRQFVEAVHDTGCTILDTRKTTPLWRDLEKYAVRVGGGKNHRLGLYDMYLIKENHIAAAGGISPAIERALQHRADRGKPLLIEVEVRNREEFLEAAQFPVDRILLDNMTAEQVREIVHLNQSGIELEVSGGVDLKNIRAYAETGVSFISIGKITHSVPALDVSMLFEKQSGA